MMCEREEKNVKESEYYEQIDKRNESIYRVTNSFINSYFYCCSNCR